ncbi:MAG TPA: TylF/MycF/NovP-related O-methyltransferase [Sphingomonas sp.]|uniref:TylF/MycF/NovP-related O-methyltransferase n=1 Tax=Sphingomonas sp. TaxID=28214 RepID=UPI002CD4ECC3|nr:TylF/MycF/NovP-related O-methyltransferase [Sphingomonas sp.]HMI20880.1 TylF/MycF/NovP-related O-methyltransferase [Sphingomonas sp.]
MTDDLRYESVLPNATYAPWLADADFQAAFAQIRDHTLVDHFRCYELWQLVEQALRLPGDMIEVGVWRGGTGCLMARRAQLLGSPAKMVLCDTFAGVVKAGRKDGAYRGGEHADTSLETVRALAGAMGLANIETLTGIFPEDTGDKVADRTFSLCHIDVDVYQSGLDVLEWVWPRMPVGGIVIYDDYGFATCDGITRLVNERYVHDGAVTLHNLNGHAVVIKTAGAKPFWKRLLGR